MPENQNSESEIKKIRFPINKWASISSWCVLLSVICLLMAFVAGNIADFLEVVFGLGCLFFLLVAFVTGLTALIKIEKSKGTLRGELFAYTGIFAAGFFLFIGEYGRYMGTGRPPYYRSSLTCGANLKGLGNALAIYEYDYGTYPNEQWCDRLIQFVDVSPKSLVCPASDDIEGECSYALNKYIAGKKHVDSPDVVLAFETTQGIENKKENRPIRERESFNKYPLLSVMFKGDEEVCLECWNQVGGPEDLNASAHNHTGQPEGCNIVFTNGHTQWFSIDELPDLKWDPADDSIRWDGGMMREVVTQAKMLAAIKKRNLFILEGTLAALSIVGWLLIPGTKIKGFGLLVAIAAALMGAYWAWETEKLYTYYSRVYAAPIGLQTGLFWGAFTGIFYSLLICRLHKRGRVVPWGSKSMHVQYDLLWAMAAGLLCSTSVHITLGLHHEMDAWGALSPGIYFGLLAGILTGAIARVIFVSLFAKKVESQPISNQKIMEGKLK